MLCMWPLSLYPSAATPVEVAKGIVSKASTREGEDKEREIEERIRSDEGEQRTSEWILFLLEPFFVRGFLPFARHGLRWWMACKWEYYISRSSQ